MQALGKLTEELTEPEQQREARYLRDALQRVRRLALRDGQIG